MLRQREAKSMAPGETAETGETIAIFEPDLSETTTLARVGEILAGGFRPIVFGFRRARYNRRHVAPWSEIELGRTRDGRYMQRLIALLGALPTLLAHRQRLRSARAFLARNLDQLCLALLARAFFNHAAPLAYEVVDIQPSFTRSGWRAGAMRLFERLCLRRIDLLVVSSPGFHRNYFVERQKYRGDWLLVENKLRLSSGEIAQALLQRSAVAKPLAPARKWSIGYFGLIRGQATIELMIRLAKALPDLIEIKFRGVVTTVNETWFRTAIADAGNISYDGEYSNPGDLARIYGGVDLVWALDLENIECNSRWLLPCRFYEAGLFGVPCMAVRGFEVGRALDELGLGWTFEPPLEQSLIAFFKELTVDAYDAKRRHLLACPVETFATGSTSSDLSLKLAKLAGRKPRRKAAAPIELARDAEIGSCEIK